MAPSSEESPPINLLWAYQLKREHALLLQRMIALEKGTANKVLDDHNATQDRKIDAKLEDMQTRFEGITSKIAAIGAASLDFESFRQKTFETQVSLLRRIGSAEDRLNSFVPEIAHLKQQMTSLDDANLSVSLVKVKEQCSLGKSATAAAVAAVSEQVQEVMRMVQDERRDNDGLKSEVKALKAMFERYQVDTVPSGSVVQDTALAEEVASKDSSNPAVTPVTTEVTEGGVATANVLPEIAMVPEVYTTWVKHRKRTKKKIAKKGTSVPKIECQVSSTVSDLARQHNGHSVSQLASDTPGHYSNKDRSASGHERPSKSSRPLPSRPNSKPTTRSADVQKQTRKVSDEVAASLSYSTSHKPRKYVGDRTGLEGSYDGQKFKQPEADRENVTCQAKTINDASILARREVAPKPSQSEIEKRTNSTSDRDRKQKQSVRTNEVTKVIRKSVELNTLQENTRSSGMLNTLIQPKEERFDNLASDLNISVCAAKPAASIQVTGNINEPPHSPLPSTRRSARIAARAGIRPREEIPQVKTDGAWPDQVETQEDVKRECLSTAALEAHDTVSRASTMDVKLDAAHNARTDGVVAMPSSPDRKRRRVFHADDDGLEELLRMKRRLLRRVSIT